MDNTTIILDFKPDGKTGSGTITASLGGEVLHVDRIDIRKETGRAKFIKAITNLCPGIDTEARKALYAELLQLAGQEARREQKKDVLPGAPEMPAADRREALTMLRDPELLRIIVDDVARLGVAGEKTLTATVYIVGTSRLLDKPLAAIVQGLTSSGKSYVLDTVARMFPPEAVIHAHRMTPEALYHLPEGELVHKFIVAGERSRKQGDDTADVTKALREMLSSGKLTKLVPEKQGNGKIETVLIEQCGPIAYVESTTLQKIRDEDRNRCLILSSDESPTQTRRVIDSSAERAEAEPGANGDAEEIVRRHHNGQRLLCHCKVRIPFAKRLAETFPSKRTDARRTFEQLLSVIKAVTLLNQYQRIAEPADGAVIEAGEEDYELARRLLAEPFALSLGDTVSVAARNFADRLKEYFGDKEFDSQDVTQHEGVIGDVQTIRSYLRSLASAGILYRTEEHRGRKRARYRLAPARNPTSVAGLPEYKEIGLPVSPPRQCVNA